MGRAAADTDVAPRPFIDRLVQRPEIEGPSVDAGPGSEQAIHATQHPDDQSERLLGIEIQFGQADH